MGGEWSAPKRDNSPDPWWGNTQPGTSRNVPFRREENLEKKEERPSRKVNQEEMDAFKKEIARKRELRRAAIASVQCEMKKLKTDLEAERTLRKAIEEETRTIVGTKCDQTLSEEIKRLQFELEEEKRMRKETEDENSRLKEKEEELEAFENQVRALKEVASIGREMLRIRELQVNELKRKLQEIELSLPTAPEELRLEYEAQIQNIRKLRSLYEERALATRTEHQQERDRDTAKINVLELKINELKEEVQENKDINTSLEVKITKFEETVEEKTNEIESLQDQLYTSSVECRSLKSQMKIINNLFSQVLAGPEFDLDRLTRLLKENHGLITDLTATGDTNDVAALLLDIAEKAEGDSPVTPQRDANDLEENLQKGKEEIASNLSKVWRVLVELLSHHKDVNTNNAGSESCYKSVDTPSGPRQVISVSQTFLTLKDLILEKNSLVKEVGRLKTLNSHLENRMHNQERRLSTVSTELKKTWSVVSKLRAQHKQLHNHEKILRYELQHKRQMLTELKQELEHCREKWDRARQKNTQSEEDWKQLRKEFALRKQRKLSNSAESGYEEEDSHSSPSEEISEPSDSKDNSLNLIPIKQDNSEISDGDISEDDVEHSDGNSYETVIDLLDIACLESQIENENLTNSEELISLIGSQDETPLTDSELTEGLSHIESLELVSELDVCQTNILTPEFLSPIFSSSSSPIPTETEDLTSLEVDISEEIPRSNSPYHQLHYTEEPIVVPDIPRGNLLFGSNSAQNISRFLEGLFVTDVQILSETDVMESVREGSEEYSVVSSSEQLCENNLNKQDFLQNELLHTSPKEIMQPSKIQTFTSTQEIKLQNDVVMQDNLASTSGESLFEETFYPQIPQTSNISETIFNYDIPKILIVSENISTIKPDHKNPEITEEKSVFDSECVANAIQLCLQDIQNSIPTSMQNEYKVETNEVNNNMPQTSLNLSNNEFTTETESSESLTNNSDSTVDVKAFTTELEITPQQSINNEEKETSLGENKEENIDKLTAEPITSGNGNSTISSNSGEIKPTRTPKEILEARTARLKRLEEQCKSLFSKMSATSRRSDLISNKLEELHEHYGPSQNSTKHTNSDLLPISTNLILHDSLQHENLQKSDNPGGSESLGSGSEDVVKRLNDSCLASSTDPCCSKKLENASSNEKSTDLKSEDTNSGVLDARAARLKKLEDQCKSLYTQVTKTNHKSNVICNKLQELHEHYGSSEVLTRESEDDKEETKSTEKPEDEDPQE